MATAGPARATKPSLRVSERSVFPGQAVALTARRALGRRARVTIGGKRARVLQRTRRRVTVVVPRLRPGRAKVVVRAGRRRLRARLTVRRAVGAKRLTVTRDSARTAAGIVGPQGVVVTAAGADGTTFELTVPAGAAPMGTNIALTPISKVSGAPVSDTSPFAIAFGPDGLRFSIPATLRVKPTRPTPAALAFAYSADGTRTGVLRRTGERDTLAFEIRHFSDGVGGEPTEDDFIGLLSLYLQQPALTFEDVLDVGAIIHEASSMLGGAWCSREPTCAAVRDRTRPVATSAAGRCVSDAGGVTKVGEALEEHALDWDELLLYDEVDPLIGAGTQADAGCVTQFLLAAMGVAYGGGPTDLSSPYVREPLRVADMCSDAPYDRDGDGRTVIVECAMLDARRSARSWATPRRPSPQPTCAACRAPMAA